VDTRISINIGVNRPHPIGSCNAVTLTHSEADAGLICKLAKDRGFNVTKPFGLLAGGKADLRAVRDAFDAAVPALHGEDLLLLSFSGHSCQVRDLNGDERDRLDEGWCLADNLLLDDEIFAQLARFEDGVRILLIVDSCFSDGLDFAGLAGANALKLQEMLSASGLWDELGPDRRNEMSARAGSLVAMDWLDAVSGIDPAFNAHVQKRFEKGRNLRVGASVFVMTSCRSSEKSRNGLFTAAVCRAMANGSPPASYVHLHKAVWSDVTGTNPLQHPRYHGEGTPDPDFILGPPF
jgi:hypothetical protein